MTANQTKSDDLAAGRMARDVGATIALDAADEWREAAAVELERLIASGRPFTSEDLVEAVGEPAGHPNAVGGLFIGARRQGRIVPVGYAQATRRPAHARVIRRWERAHDRVS